MSKEEKQKMKRYRILLLKCVNEDGVEDYLKLDGNEQYEYYKLKEWAYSEKIPFIDLIQD